MAFTIGALILDHGFESFGSERVSGAVDPVVVENHSLLSIISIECLLITPVIHWSLKTQRPPVFRDPYATPTGTSSSSNCSKFEQTFASYLMLLYHRVSKAPIPLVYYSVHLPPSVIVYDKACQLHIYALNREPQQFKGTLFAVDCFHWRGHVGGSSDYNLDMYITLKGLNSQVNEQANAGLQHIKSQLAYMTFDNFVSFVLVFVSQE